MGPNLNRYSMWTKGSWGYVLFSLLLGMFEICTIKMEKEEESLYVCPSTVCVSTYLLSSSRTAPFLGPHHQSPCLSTCCLQITRAAP